MSTSNRAELRGEGGTLQGSCNSFGVTTTPYWQENEKGERVCGDARQLLEITINFRPPFKCRAEREKHYKSVLQGKVEVAAPGLRFAGYVQSTNWQERFDDEGNLSSGQFTLTVEGEEK